MKVFSAYNIRALLENRDALNLIRGFSLITVPTITGINSNSNMILVSIINTDTSIEHSTKGQNKLNRVVI